MTRPQEPPPDPTEEESEDHLADRWIGPYVRDMSLWPVMLVLLAHAVMGIGLALLSASRSRSLPALAALALLGFGSAHAIFLDLQRRRFGITSRMIVLTWALGAVAAWAAGRSGIF